MENLKIQELNRQNLEDIAYRNQQQENRNNQYKNKINGLNEKIYNNAQNLSRFINEGSNEPFHVNN